MAEVDICNEALSVMGSRSTIASLSENSAEAIQCNLRFETIRDQLFRLAHWGFAKKYGTAAMLKSAPGTTENTDAQGVWSNDWPPPPWLYSYAYPAEGILVRAVLPQPYTLATQTTPIYPYSSTTVQPQFTRAAKFKTGLDTDSNGNTVRAIFTNQQQALLCYTAKITDTTLFDSLFRTALIHALASEIAFPLSGDKQLANMLAQKANNVILAARVADANETIDVIDHTPDWLRIRGAGGSDAVEMYTEPYGPLFGGV
jgi:hypothetical protein